VAEAIAREAGDLLEARRDEGGLSWHTKSTPTDVVTEADLAAEQMIRERLAERRPGDGMLGEEGSDDAGTTGVRWVVDPLDGTVNYLYDLPYWSVSIAAEVAGDVVAGVVHAPRLRETYVAHRGGGAFRNEQPIRPSTASDLATAMLGSGFSYDPRRRAHQAQWLALVLPRVRDLRRYGSAALDLCSLAAGRLDLYAEQGLNPWDAAAGGLIVTEAGGRLGGLHGAAASTAMTVAATPQLWDAFTELLLEVGADHDPLAQSSRRSP